jgi:16S rRNA (cytosine1402-N4)-methyltransferase
VLLDLGISSPQIDDPGRGFSFRADGPLDMRMDPTRGESAAAFLARADARELTEVIRDYGEERFAQSVARAIVAARAVAPIVRTRQLAAVVAEAVRTRPRGDWGQDPATRTFQALRIFVNRELAELALTLPAIVSLLAAGGRLAVISFHSLEDRIVKRFMAQASQPYGGDPRLLRFAIPEAALPGAPLRLVGRAIRPGEREIAANPRARSATLRVAERTEWPVPAGFAASLASSTV